MNEPTIWMQMGISEERYRTVVFTEIQSLLSTKETIGNMMLMIQSNTKLTNDEKYYAAFMVSKQAIIRKVVLKIPAPFRVMVENMFED